MNDNFCKLAHAWKSGVYSDVILAVLNEINAMGTYDLVVFSVEQQDTMTKLHEVVLFKSLTSYICDHTQTNMAWLRRWYTLTIFSAPKK
jgi:hypothetical protein